ncbi:MAG: single-stranded-DNA-specific exonuclease RecJ [Planctomycetota bacterium]
MNQRWKLRAHDAALVQSIERSAGVSPVVAQILALRGITQPAKVTSFLDLKMTGLLPPEELPGLPAAVDVIMAGIADGRKIMIYGDYDCDGMTSTAIMYLTLKKLGADVSYHVPNRLGDGYGVSNEGLDKIAKRGAQLVITVDCGISSVDQVEYAKTLGMDMVITDHHQFGSKLPDARAIVHPALPDHEYPFHGLCGAGVAFKLSWALCKSHVGSDKLPPDFREFLFSMVALAAIGTVADVVPLLDENRLIVHHGLGCMRRFSGPGLKYLMKLAGLDERPELESDDIGFQIGPRLNAAGRLGQAQLGVEILTCDSPDRAIALGDYLDKLNANRKSIERKIFTSAKKAIKANFDPASEPALVISDNDWHLGVIGVVAGKIAEHYHRPSIVISVDPLGNRPATGSCRSSCGVDLFRALQGCSDLLIRFGGHSGAAGLTIDPGNIDAFREAFCHHVLEQVGSGEIEPELEIDAEALISQMTLPTMNELKKLAPFGHLNPRPLLCATGVRLSEPPKTMGDGSHIALRLEQQNSRIRAVGFGKGDWLKNIDAENGLYDFAFKPVINDFMGRRRVELQLVDFRPSEDDT